MEEAVKRLRTLLLPDCTYDSSTPDKRQAAVLVILYMKNGIIRVVLTKRAAHLRHHPGEIALPGGRHDPLTDATVADTAFREAHEEIGVSMGELVWVGRLEAVRSRQSNFTVHPIIVTIDGVPKRFSKSSEEVELVFTMPLSKFLETTSHKRYNMEDGIDLHVIKHGSHRVMGMTSAILIQTATIVYNRPPQFPFRYPSICVCENGDTGDIVEILEIDNNNNNNN